MRKERGYMITCKYCGTVVVPVMSFSKDKKERFCRCPKCHSETRHVPLKEAELSFGEHLHRESVKYKEGGSKWTSNGKRKY